MGARLVKHIQRADVSTHLPVQPRGCTKQLGIVPTLMLIMMCMLFRFVFPHCVLHPLTTMGYLWCEGLLSGLGDVSRCGQRSLLTGDRTTTACASRRILLFRGDFAAIR
jgi:hypothetical protein